MGVARIVVLALAALSAIFVALYVRGAARPEVIVQPLAQREQSLPVSRVVIARENIPFGHRLTPEDLKWQLWPDAVINEDYFVQSEEADAIALAVGRIARADITAGEPITHRKVIKAGDRSAMAAVLEEGHRAVAVRISSASASGGFILPGDRVDVLLTYEVDAGGRGGTEKITRTILREVRVLAIDQILATAEESAAVVGSTATLELTPEDAEFVVLAEDRGSLTLAQRSLAGADGQSWAGGRRSPETRFSGGIGQPRHIYRYGSVSTVYFGDKL